MTDEATTSLPSAEPEPVTPAEAVALRLSVAVAIIEEYRAVHGGLPDGCEFHLPPKAKDVATMDMAEAVVERLRAHQHSLDEGDPDTARALCLSGGGIRSATFGLGVLQGLAKAGELDKFHYLSSVSGGGYIASWLTGWLRRSGGVHGLQGVLRQLAGSAVVGDLQARPTASSVPDQRAIPQGQAMPKPPGTPASPEPEPDEIRHLRSYSNYLSPAIGVSGDVMALVAIFARNLFLHWTVLLPLIAAGLLLPRLLLALLPMSELPLAALRALTAVAVAAVLLAVAYMAADLPGEPPPRGQEPANLFQRCNLLPLGAASLLFAVLSPWLTTRASLNAVPAPHDLLSWQAPGEVLGVPWQAVLAWGEWGALLHVVGGWLGFAWRTRVRKLELRPNEKWLVNLVLAALTGLLGGGVLVLVLFRLASWWPEGAVEPDVEMAALAEHLGRHEVFVTAGPPLVLGVFWLAVTLYAGFTRSLKAEEDREWWARAAGQWLLLSLGWTALATIVLMLPRWLLALLPALGLPDGVTMVGVGTGFLGLLTSAIGYWSKNGQKITGQVRGVFQRLGARALDLLSATFLVLLAVLISLMLSAGLQALDEPDASSNRNALTAQQLRSLTHAAACAPPPKVAVPTECRNAVQVSALQQSAIDFQGTLHDRHWDRVLMLAVGLAGLGAVMAWWVGVNTFSLHSMYANRLTRAYLGATNRARRPHWFTGFDPEDNPPLAWAVPAAAPTRLLPVINAALNLVQASGDRLEWQQRKAASFTFTPLHCGSPVLGYVPTRQYSNGVSIGRAMAISGAAASPNMGYHSSTLVAAVMSLFNVRLGWWMPNTRDASRDVWGRVEPSKGLNTLLVETLAGTSGDQDFVYLSDGGHFENLGLYEMVRRRCRRIVVVDATADADYRHDDLQSAIRKIRIDLGVSVEFAQGLPTAESVRRNGQPWALGRVVYRDIDAPSVAISGKPVPDGSIVYLKPALWDGLPLDVERYAQSLPKGSSPFPHQTTADQFFDESQFESYRMLGVLTVLKALGSGRWPQAPGPDHRTPPAAAQPAAATGSARRPLRQRLALRLRQ